MPKKPIFKSNRYQLLVRDKKGRFMKVRNNSYQRISIRDKETKEIFDLGFGKTDRKKLMNIGKIINKAISNIRDGTWKKLLDRDIQIKRKKIKIRKVQRLSKKQIKRFRDKKDDLKTYLEIYDIELSIFEANEIAKKSNYKMILLMWYYETDLKQIYSVSSGDILMPASETLLTKINDMMLSKVDFIFEMFLSYKEAENMNFIRAELRGSK